MAKSLHPELDPSLYVRAPAVSLDAGLPLIASLLAAVQATDSPSVREAALAMRATAMEAQSVWLMRMRQKRAIAPSHRRALDHAADVSWRALYYRLSSLASLPIEITANAARAAALVNTLFADGLGFLARDYDVQYAHMEALLARIEEDGFDEDIDALAGPEFLAAVRAAHGPYGAMIRGIQHGDSAPPSDVNLLHHTRAIMDAITSYSIQVIATVKQSEPETTVSARRLLAPLDAYRASHHTAKAAGYNEAVSMAPPAAPMPEVPGGGVSVSR